MARAEAARITAALATIRNAMRAPVETAYAESDITGRQRDAMDFVVRRGEVQLNELATALHLAKSSTSELLDRLEARGLVVRHPDAKDGRKSVIRPTAHVMEYVQTEGRKLPLDPIEQALERASPSERDAIAIAIERLAMLVRPA